MSEEIDTTIADMLHGADLLSVVADKCEETGATAIMQIAAEAAGDAYYHVGVKLQDKGRNENAREAFVKAHAHFLRAETSTRSHKFRIACQGAHVTYPQDGNGYW